MLVYPLSFFCSIRSKTKAYDDSHVSRTYRWASGKVKPQDEQVETWARLLLNLARLGRGPEGLYREVGNPSDLSVGRMSTVFTSLLHKDGRSLQPGQHHRYPALISPVAS